MPSISPEILLSSGKYFNFLDPNPDHITISVVADALSKQCRFSGQCSRFYSVAEHCVRASYIDPTLETLLHDAAEAFVVDVPTPLKILLPEYKAIEDRVHQAVAAKFGLTYPWPEATKHADLVMLATEKRDLMPATDEQWPILEGVAELPKSIRMDVHAISTWAWLFEQRFAELSAC